MQIVEIMPYKTFKDKIRLTKQYKKHKITVCDTYLLIEREENQMTKVRCTYEVCDWCNEGLCDRGSISIYYGECKSTKVTHDVDSYDDED